ncbi:MAG: PA2778 family cysteine peptidase [Proteobacteria bacterium]|nr:PA2778 family cysteine peptidase [Pseudomonadota bacterium]
MGLAMWGCARTPLEKFPTAGGVDVELSQTPFFPQESHQCGPAALATVLGASGVVVMPAELVPQTYLPGRQGSLQLELIASARRQQRIPYVLAPDAATLFAELDAGHPVLVLQDLGVGPLHVWHYAVVIGYRTGQQQMLLRSGTTEILRQPYDAFMRSWRKGGQWALVVLGSESLPATADAARYVESIVPIEALGYVAFARDAYSTALTRWPDSPLALFGLANTEHRLGALGAAERAYRRLLLLAPKDPIVLNNLAEVMLDQGCAALALRYADEALALVPPNGDLASAIGDTAAHAVAAQALGRDANECSR